TLPGNVDRCQEKHCRIQSPAATQSGCLIRLSARFNLCGMSRPRAAQPSHKDTRFSAQEGAPSMNHQHLTYCCPGCQRVKDQHSDGSVDHDWCTMADYVARHLVPGQDMLLS